MTKVILVTKQYKDTEPEINVFMSPKEAVEFAKGKAHQMSKRKGQLKRYEVKGFIYFGLNLAEGILVTAQERNIITTTSSSYTSDFPIDTSPRKESYVLKLSEPGY